MRLNNLGEDARIVFKNFSYLSLMKLFNVGLKFFLVIFLIRVLGDTNYGMVTWLDSIIQYFIMFINFGFNVYAAKYIVDNIDRKEQLNDVATSILTIKLFLFLLSILIVILIGRMESMEAYNQLLLLFIFSGAGEVMFPIWYFQGKEDLRPATVIVFLSRAFLVITVLLLVRAKEDAAIYIFLLVCSSIIMGLSGFAYIKNVYGFAFVPVRIEKLVFFLKEAIPFFLGRFLSLIFNFGTIFIIGKFCNLSDVAGFDIALKVVIVGTIPFEMLQQALFPTLARNQNKALLKRAIWISVILGVLIGAIIFISAPYIIQLFGGPAMADYAQTLKVLAFMTPFIALTFVIGSCALVAFGHFRAYNTSLIGTSIIYIIAVFVLWINDDITYWHLIYIRVGGEIVMVLIRLFYAFSKRVLVLK